MSDPRGNVSFLEIAADFVTVKSDNSTILYDKTQPGGCGGPSGINTYGLAVTLSANSTVALTQDGNQVFGRLIAVKSDNFAVVEVSGGMVLPGGASATLTVGTRIVGALGASSAKGYIRSVAATTGSYVQATATETQVARGMIIDSSDSTNVAVWL